MNRFGLFTVLGICLAAAPALATSVEPTGSSVSINKGAGFKKVTGSTPATAGNTVMVGPGGSAVVHFGDGCDVNLEAGSVYNVPAGNPCQSSVASAGIGVGYAVGAAATIRIGVAVVGFLKKDRPSSP